MPTEIDTPTWEESTEDIPSWEDSTEDVPKWEDSVEETGKPFEIKPSPYEQAALMGTPSGMEAGTEFLTEIAQQPKGFPKAAAQAAGQVVMAPLALAGQALRASAEDIGASLAKKPSLLGTIGQATMLPLGFGTGGIGENVSEFLKRTSPIEAEKPMPYQETLAEVSKTHPYAAFAAKTAGGLIESAPIMAAGLPQGVLGKLIATGFTADMIRNAYKASGELGKEMGKPPEQRDQDKITTLLSEIAQSATFAPMMGAHVAGKPITERFMPKRAAIEELSRQLTSGPIEGKLPVIPPRIPVVRPDERGAPIPGLPERQALMGRALQEAQQRIFMPGEVPAIELLRRQEADQIQPPTGEVTLPTQFGKQVFERTGPAQVEPAPLPVQAPGGRVSFAAPSRSEGVPSARQSALTGAGGGETQPPDLIEQVRGIVFNKDRLGLNELLKQTEAMPGSGVALALRNDLLRIIESRLKEIRTDKPNAELDALRNTLKERDSRPKPTVETFAEREALPTANAPRLTFPETQVTKPTVTETTPPVKPTPVVSELPESVKGGAESGLSPEAQAISRANNSLRKMAEVNGVEFVEGDTPATILAKINAKSKPTEPPKPAAPVSEIKVGDVIEAKSHQVKGLVHRGKVTSIQGDEIGMINQDSAPVLVLRKNVNKPAAPVVPEKPTVSKIVKSPTLLEFAKSKLPKSVADKITSESQVESFRAQWEKEYPPVTEKLVAPTPKPTPPVTEAKTVKPVTRGRVTQTQIPSERLEQLLAIEVPDVEKSRQKLRLLQELRQPIQEEYSKLLKESEAIKSEITVQRGNKWQRGQIKKSAPAKKVQAYRDLQKKLVDLDNQARQLMESGKADQAAVDAAVDASIISDTKQPLMRRLDRQIRRLQDLKQPIPDELIRARSIEAEKILSEKYPDITDEEIVAMEPELQREAYFGTKMDSAFQVNPQLDLYGIRRAKLEALMRKDVITDEAYLPEELSNKLKRFLPGRRRYGDVLGPDKPAENLTPKDIVEIDRELTKNTAKVRAESEAKRIADEEARVAAELAETKMIDEAQKVADSAVRSGRPGGRSAAEVKTDMIGRIKSAVDTLADTDQVKLTKNEEGSYSAVGQAGGFSLGEVEITEKGKFKVTTWDPSLRESRITVTVETLPEAESIIRGMAARGIGKTVIGVPGDGVFRMWNDGRVLLSKYVDARKIDVSKGRATGSGGSGPRAEMPPKQIRTAEDWRSAKQFHELEEGDKIFDWSNALNELAKKINPKKPESVTTKMVDDFIEAKRKEGQPAKGLGGKLREQLKNPPSDEAGFYNLHNMVYDAGRAVYRKGMEFAEWSKRMISEFGDAVREFLQTAWDRIHGVPNLQTGKGIAESMGVRFDSELGGLWNFTAFDNNGKLSTAFSIKAGSTPQEVRDKYTKLRVAYMGEPGQPRPALRPDPPIPVSKFPPVPSKTGRIITIERPNGTRYKAATDDRMWPKEMIPPGVPTGNLIHRIEVDTAGKPSWSSGFLDPGEKIVPDLITERHAGIPIPGADKLVKKTRDTLKTLWQTKGIRSVMAYTKDATQAAQVYGQRVANDIRGPLRAAMGRGKKPNVLDENALSFVIESGGDRRQLAAMRSKLAASTAASPKWKAEAIRAIDHADANWNRLQPIADQYAAKTDAQLTAEHAAGINTVKHDNYVMHAQDVQNDFGLFDVSSGEGSSGFKHIRSFPTFADSIAAGIDPKSINAVTLLAQRVARGQQLINNRAWVDSLRNTVDPKTGKVIVTSPEVIQRGPGMPPDIRAPQDYVTEIAGGRPIAVLKPYAGIFRALSQPSVFRNSAGWNALLKTAGVGKSVTLILDTFHLGRLAFWESIIKPLSFTDPKAPIPSFKKGVLTLDYSPAELRRMAATGEIPPAQLPELLRAQNHVNQLVKRGYNIAKISDALHQEWIQELPILGTFNKWLFNQFQRGAMAEVGAMEVPRYRRMHPSWTEDQVYRAVAKDLNIRFGNLGRQGIFKSRTAQDIARTIFLAPQWNEGLIRAEIGAVTGTLKGVADSFKEGRPAFGVIPRAVGAMMLGQLVANQIINFATRGKPTWQNEEEGFGAKISAWVPDVIGQGPGFFLHPAGLAAEITHLLHSKYEKKDDFREALMGFMGGRWSTLARPVMTFLTRRDVFQRLIRPEDIWKETGKTMVPLPIGAAAAVPSIEQMVGGEVKEKFPGQYQRQLMASVGVKADQAPSAIQRIQALKHDFNKKLGVKESGEFYESAYVPLRQALSRGALKEAQQAYQELLKANYKPKQIADQIKPWTGGTLNVNTLEVSERHDKPFTGTLKNERMFMKTLTPEQRRVYELAKEERKRIYRNFVQMRKTATP